MKKVLLRAPLLTNSGYGVHSRQIFEWLLEKENLGEIKLDVECLKWGNTPWLMNADEENNLTSEIMKRSKALEAPYDVSFQLQLPDEWNPSLGKFNVGLSAFVETERCSDKWVACCNKMDVVITPSTFTKNLVKRSGSIKKDLAFHVVPEWFNENLLSSKNVEETKLPSVTTKFNYLLIGMLTSPTPEDDRKNLFNTIRWLFEKHKNNSDVGVILKTCLGKGTKKDLIETEKLLKHIVEKFRREYESNLKFYLVHGNMSSREIAGLYKNKKVKCLVSATRGEGYGLPLVDAAAAGIPVIATNWSGHLEFLKHYNFLPVDYELKEISERKVDNRIFFSGFRWAEPKKQSFFECIDNLHKNYENISEQSFSSAELIQEKFCKQTIKKSYDNIFLEIL